MENENGFKKIIQALLGSFNKVCSEKDLRKAYREQEGENINVKLEQFNHNTSLQNYLHFKCNDICSVYRIDGEVKIQRKSTESTQHMDKLSKAHTRPKKKNNPMLQRPKRGYSQQQTFTRPNTQGFYKNKENLNKIIKIDKQKDVPIRQARSSRAYKKQFSAPTKQMTLGSFLDGNLAPQINDNAGHHKQFMTESFNYTKIYEVREQNVANDSNFPALPKTNGNLVDSGISKSDDSEEEITKLVKTCDLKCVDYQRYSNHNTHIIEKELFFETKLCSDDEKVHIREDFSEYDNLFNQSLDEILSKVNNETSLLIDDPIFFMDFPDVIQSPITKMPKPQLKVFGVKVLFPVFLTTIYSPTEFYFQYDEETVFNLMSDMQTFYSSLPIHGLKISTKNIKIGLVVAAKLLSIWHRAEIVGELDESGNVEVLFSDFGVTNIANIRNIRYLLAEYAQHPIKSLRGAIINIQPNSHDLEWSEEARCMFFRKISNKTLFVSIRSYEYESDTFQLDIFESLTSEKSIADELIEENYAIEKLTEFTFPYAIFLSSSEAQN